MSKLQDVLNDEESMKQLQELASMFGNELSQSDNEQPPPTFSANNNNNNNNEQSSQNDQNAGFSQLLSNLGGLFGSNNQGNQNTGNQVPNIMPNQSNQNMSGQNGQSGDTPDLSQLISSLGGMLGSGGNTGTNSNQNGTSQMPNFDIGKIMQLQTIMASANKSDKNVDLLLALKPLLKEESQLKIDRLVKIFKLFAVYPVLKQSGLLGGDLLGLL